MDAQCRITNGLMVGAAVLAAYQFSLCLATGAGVPPDASANASVQECLNYISARMDEYHLHFDVSTDVGSAGDHFHAFTKFPNANAPVALNGSWATAPHSGATCIQCVFTADPNNPSGGWIFQNGVLSGADTAPQPNFGTTPNAGVDLTGATALTFWARGTTGREVVDFFVAGVGYDDPRQPTTPTAPYPDSSPAIHHTITLSKTWKQYRISLIGHDMSYVLGGFGWGCGIDGNPTGATFYLDDIQYDLGAGTLARRLSEPRVIRSYLTRNVQPTPGSPGDIDLVQRNVAYLYDNSLAILALLADGRADSVRRAILVGDALVYAQQHDQVYTDGSLRDSMVAGDLALPPGWTPGGIVGCIGVPGYYVENTQTFFEIGQYQHSVGNQAWAMTALLALYQRTHIPDYLTAATRIGDFILTYANDAGMYPGFLFGLDSPTGTPEPVTYSSSEHNLDVYAAFTLINSIAPDPKWTTGAALALGFVDAMWDPARGCYYAGTTDLTTRNDNAANDPNWAQLPLDVQAWSILSLNGARASRNAQIFAFTSANMGKTDQNFTGFDFNNDRDGVWPEGTGQLTAVYAVTGNAASTKAYRKQLHSIQDAAGFGVGGGLPAATHDGLTTGFNFLYYNRPHLGATSWNVFAQLGVNPYYLNPVAPLPGHTAKPGISALQARVAAAPGGLANVNLTATVSCFAGIRSVTATFNPAAQIANPVPLAPVAGSHTGGAWLAEVPVIATTTPYQVVISVADTEGNLSTKSLTVRTK